VNRIDPLTRLVAGAGGALLATGTRLLGAVRPARKPLHPAGRVVTGRLRRHGLTPPTGVVFVDEDGDEAVLVRESRAVGLPEPLPDVHGLAIRVTGRDMGPGDLLLSSTGWGRLTRFVLTASRSTWGRPMTTLLPYATVRGPMLIGARAVRPGVVELACAVGVGPWRTFAELSISTDEGSDPTISFDPVAHRLAGLDQYAAIARLREPAYRAARRSRTSATTGHGSAPPC
jgi:hypothetical protein